MSAEAIDHPFAHFRAVTLYVILYNASPLDELKGGPEAREKLLKFLINALRAAAKARCIAAGDERRVAAAYASA